MAAPSPSCGPSCSDAHASEPPSPAIPTPATPARPPSPAAALTCKAAVTSNDGGTINGGDADLNSPRFARFLAAVDPSTASHVRGGPCATPTAAAPSGPSSSPAPRHTAAWRRLARDCLRDRSSTASSVTSGRRPGCVRRCGCSSAASGSACSPRSCCPTTSSDWGCCSCSSPVACCSGAAPSHRRTRWSLLTTVVCLGPRLARRAARRRVAHRARGAHRHRACRGGARRRDGAALAGRSPGVVAARRGARAAAPRAHGHRDEPPVDPLADRAHRRDLARRPRRLRRTLRLG